MTLHAPTWIAPELGLLFDRHLGPDWVERHGDISFWNRVMDIPDEEFWNVDLFLKRKFLAFARERAPRPFHPWTRRLGHKPGPPLARTASAA